MKIERKERRFQHRLIQYFLRLEIERRSCIGVLHHLIRQLLGLFRLGVNPLVVEELAEGVENRQLQVLRMQSLFSLLLLYRLAAPLFRAIFFRFFFA